MPAAREHRKGIVPLPFLHWDSLLPQNCLSGAPITGLVFCNCLLTYNTVTIIPGPSALKKVVELFLFLKQMYTFSVLPTSSLGLVVMSSSIGTRCFRQNGAPGGKAWSCRSVKRSSTRLWSTVPAGPSGNKPCVLKHRVDQPGSSLREFSFEPLGTNLIPAFQDISQWQGIGVPNW